MFGTPSIEITPNAPVVFQSGSATLTCTARLQLQSTGLCNHTNCASFDRWVHTTGSGIVRLDGSSNEDFKDGVLVVTSELQLSSSTPNSAGFYSCLLYYENITVGKWKYTTMVRSVQLSVTG